MIVRRNPQYREPVCCVHVGHARINIPDLIDGFITWHSTLPCRANQETPFVDKRVFQNRGVCGQAFPSLFSPPPPRTFLRPPQFSCGQKSEKCIERAESLTACYAGYTTDRKVLLSSFHLNGQTLGFHPQTQKMEPPCTASQIPPQGTTTYAVATSNQRFLAYHYLVKQTNPED